MCRVLSGWCLMNPVWHGHPGTVYDPILSKVHNYHQLSLRSVLAEVCVRPRIWKKKGKECEDRFNWYFKKAPLTCVVVYVTIHILFSEKVKTPSAPHLSVVEFLHLPEIYLIYSQSITKLEGLMVYSQNPKNPDLSLEEDWWSQSHQNRIVGKIPFLGHAWILRESKKKPWKKINMEAENPLIEKENHLNQTSIFWWGPAVDFSGIVLAENVRPKNPAMALESRKSLMEPERCGGWVVRGGRWWTVEFLAWGGC